MSRIEEALEKAAKLRSTANTANTEGVRRSTATAPSYLLPPAALEGIKVTNNLLVAASDPLSPVAEDYRKLKSLLVRLTKGESFRNMLMVTSSIGCEGKSITALNLALTLAQEYDHTVLVVDADLRKPSLHDYLGVEQRAGLSECLLEGLDIRRAIVKTGIGRLSFLPAGREIGNAEIFSSQRTREFFLEIKHRYPDRYIIIDTPPILPFAETRSLSAMVDGVVLVVREGMVSMRQLNETLTCLKGINLLGIVYNEATVEGEAEQYYRTYRRGHAEAGLSQA